MEFVHPFCQGQCIPAFPAGSKVFGHLETGSLGFADDHGEGGTFSYSVITRVGMDSDEEVLGIVHGPGRDGKGHHRDAESVDIDMEDLHN